MNFHAIQLRNCNVEPAFLTALQILQATRTMAAQGQDKSGVSSYPDFEAQYRKIGDPIFTLRRVRACEARAGPRVLPIAATMLRKARSRALRES